MGIPSELTRRAWLRLIAAGSAALTVGCGDNLPSVDAASAVLEPTEAGFILAVWARHAREATVTLRVDGQLAMHRLLLGEGGSGMLAFRELLPATEYELIIRTADDILLGPHHIRTAPRADDPRPVRIAVAADLDPNPAFASDLVEHVIAAAPDLLVTLGDFPYTDNGPPAHSLAEYRERHAELRTLPRVRALLEAVPVRAIYDDHEFRNNWDAAFVATEAERYAAAMTVWDEFFPLREPGSAADEVRYRSWRWGAHVECFLLDCRRFRSANAAPDDDRKSMLGETQRAWLTAGLRASTATFKLVFTSVPLDIARELDTWTGFQTERDALFEAVVGIPGLLFVSGDQHYFAVNRHAFGIREVQIGPLARGLGAIPVAGPGRLFVAQRFNVGLIEIDGDRLVIAGLGEGGERFYEESLSPADLTARRPG
ncbi:MAG: alkaline phosphatase D family protein [Myxococcota bacterium]|nr:alkaline phosphatase D family protein [Myxococcota bacterium]